MISSGPCAAQYKRDGRIVGDVLGGVLDEGGAFGSIAFSRKRRNRSATSGESTGRTGRVRVASRSGLWTGLEVGAIAGSVAGTVAGAGVGVTGVSGLCACAFTINANVSKCTSLIIGDIA